VFVDLLGLSETWISSCLFVDKAIGALSQASGRQQFGAKDPLNSATAP
jgi:hypothetical protein